MNTLINEENMNKLLKICFEKVLSCFKSFYTFFKKLSKIEKFLKKCDTFQKKMSNSSYIYRMKEKIMLLCTEFDGEA
jgi:hypothetical protein